MRLIDADKLIGALHDHAFLDGDDRSIACNVIQKQPTVSSWISVKDKMPPNDDTKVLTYGNPVTHWMPLPEPPEEDKDGQR